ncbi:MAG: hypothetical protein ACI9XP_000232 [Lentimonas sp.]|jgi:hypothetical protein
MKISYSINQNEFLEYQLFTAFRSKNIQQKQLRGKMLMTFITAGLGIFLFTQKEIGLGLYFAFLSVLIFIFHQRYFNFRLKRQYLRYIQSRLKDKLGAKCDMSFEENQIKVTDSIDTNIHQTKDIVELAETKLLLFIKFTTGTILFFPKKDLQRREEFDGVIENYGLKIQSFVDWKY